MDDKGFVITGRDFAPTDVPINRAPLPLETSVAGVFAIGDVRAGSTKRVGAAIGEGAAVVAQIHAALAHSALNRLRSAREHTRLELSRARRTACRSPSPS